MDGGHDHYALEEVRAAIREIARTNSLRLALRSYARRRAWALGLSEYGDDLFQEAYVRSWDGSRAWRRDLTVTQNMISIIRSLAWRDHLIREREPASGGGPSDEAEGIGVLGTTANDEPGPEARMLRTQRVRHALEAILRNVPPGGRHREVLMLQQQDVQAKKIQEALGLSKTELDTIQRAIDRAKMLVKVDE